MNVFFISDIVFILLLHGVNRFCPERPPLSGIVPFYDIVEEEQKRSVNAEFQLSHLACST